MKPNKHYEYHGFEIKRQNRIVDGVKQAPLLIPVLQLCAFSMKEAKRIIDDYNYKKNVLSELKQMAEELGLEEIL